MEDPIITDEALLGDAQLTSANAGSAGGTVAPDSMTLAELNAYTGKAFPSKEAALKSFKDTYSYVGKRIEDIKSEVLNEVKGLDKSEALAQELAEMRRERFFDKNPQYADPNTREIINKLGGNPAEVVESPSFKAVFEKVQGYDETQKLKTVLEPNFRLASSRDNLTKAAEVQAQGGSTDSIEALVASAVKDAYGFK